MSTNICYLYSFARYLYSRKQSWIIKVNISLTDLMLSVFTTVENHNGIKTFILSP